MGVTFMSQTPTQFNEIINKGSTAEYTVPLKTLRGVVVPLADISALTLTLQQVDKPYGGPEVLGAVVNGRDEQNILNLNNVVVADGLLTYTLQPLDTVILVNTNQYETHRGAFVCTYGGGQVATWDVDFTIRNLLGVS